MTLKTDGLTNIGMGNGKTTNFLVEYDTVLFDSLPASQQSAVKANLIANANALLSVIENEFTALTGWFNVPSSKFGTGHRQVVKLNQADGSGAVNWGYGGDIHLDAQSRNNNAANAADIVNMLFVAEFAEVLMDINGKWSRFDSSGEGLSMYCSIERFPAGNYDYYGSLVDMWLNKHPRQDWVNATEGTDGNFISFACAVASIYYLNTQLNFSIDQIIAAGASNLASTYRNLTADSGDPYPFFAGLLEHVYPSSANVSLPGPDLDDPFPEALLSFWMDKNTFGKDEVQDVINTSGGKWEKAFWLVVEGFSKDSFSALSVTIPALTGSFARLNGVSISQHLSPQNELDIDFENATDPQAPQRIRVPFDIMFDSASLADFPPLGSQAYELDASLTIAGTKVRGSDASTQFALIAGADPYFTNIDPAQNNVFYLSQDLRVFTATPAQNSNPISGGPAFTDDSPLGAFSYIQQLLTWLNDPSNHFTDGTKDPFASGIIPQPADALQGDSSVTPFTYDFSDFFNPKRDNNYNFAVVRVRLRGTAGPAGAAKNVRLFFRLWSTETADTDYQTGSTYPCTWDTAGQPDSPLVGTDHNTLPFFATGDLSGNTDYVAGGANIRDIQIPDGQDNIWAYYGCFLNLYDSNNVIDGTAVQGWLTGTHHCIVAQIAYDDAPIYPGASPESSDKLAQRNLQVTLSDNPGPAATHRIPQTFDLRPSAAVSTGLLYPDELMIDWGSIPDGSVASIYWPQVLASDVLALASKIYCSHTLSAGDTHTIKCKVTGGVTYVPIPPGAGENFASLFTVDLPTTVVARQEFNIVVRRIATHRIAEIDRATRALPSTKGIVKKGEKPIAGKPPVEEVEKAAAYRLRRWRYVVGTFQIKIPVATGEEMLFPEANTLAIMRWRLQQMAPSNRWYPVLERYINYIAARVDGLGGDSSSILPSPNGVPAEHIVITKNEYTGYVYEVLFDCFGDFEGFVLSDCSGTHAFKTREPGIRELVLRACREHLLLCVYAEGGHVHRIRKLVIRC